MTDLPYPFTKTQDEPYYQVALGNGEYVWVILAGDYRALEQAAEKYQQIAIDLYSDLHPHLTRADCYTEVTRWHLDGRDAK
jgi:hypothetical protein